MHHHTAKEEENQTLLNIATYNISKCENWETYLNSETWKIDVSAITQVIREAQVCICGLQEVLHKDLYTGQAQEIADSLGWNYIFVPTLTICPDGRNSDMMYGNALISCYPIISYKTIRICASSKDLMLSSIGKGAYCEERNILVAELLINGKTLTIINTHMGLANSEKATAVQAICELFKSASSPFVVMGDFNMPPDDEKLQAFKEILQDTSFFNKEPILTFPAQQPNIKLDYIFIPKQSTITQTGTIHNLASDHLPLYIKGLSL